MMKFQPISWPKLGAESLAIIISILLAFAIDAWWNERIERGEEREQLVAMRADFQASLDSLSRLLSEVRSLSEDIDELIAILKDADGQPVMIQSSLLGATISWRTSDMSTSTLDALIASGRLNLLSDPDLRSSLANLPVVLLDFTEDEVVARDFVETQMTSFLVREGLAEAAFAHRLLFEGVVSAPSEVSVLPSTEFVGLLIARRLHLAYSEGDITGLEGKVSGVQETLSNLVEQIDQQLVHLN